MVCICTTAGKLSSDCFSKIFQRLCRGQKHLKITPSRKPRCPSPSIRGTFFIPFFNASFSATALFRRVFPNVLYNLHPAKMWPAHGTEMCGLRVRQCLVVECGSGFGIGCGVGGMFVQNICFFVFLHARRLIASNEDRRLPFRAEVAQRL